MCGIVGYIGKSAANPVLKGLQDLEYRGYDSAGIAFGDSAHITAGQRTANLLQTMPTPTPAIATRYL
jgi:glutamine---fructose-6-phosphate transaminase (isomerizing)